MESLELRDRRYRAQKALNALKDDEHAEERQALEVEIAHYQEVCAHEHAEEVEGEWRCKDCDARKTTAVPEPEPEPETAPAAEAAPAESAPADEAAPATEPAAGKPEGNG